MGSRSADGDYVRFAEATLGLAEVVTGLPRRGRLGLTVALLMACESDRAARTALASAEPRRLRRAVSGLGYARALLADAELDLRRRRTLTPV